MERGSFTRIWRQPGKDGDYRIRSGSHILRAHPILAPWAAQALDCHHEAKHADYVSATIIAEISGGQRVVKKRARKPIFNFLGNRSLGFVCRFQKLLIQGSEKPERTTTRKRTPLMARRPPAL